MPPYTDLLGSLEGAILDRLIGTVLMLAVLFAVRSLLMRVVSARVSDVNTRYRWRKGINYFVMASGCSPSAVSGRAGLPSSAPSSAC